MAARAPLAPSSAVEDGGDHRLAVRCPHLAALPAPEHAHACCLQARQLAVNLQHVLSGCTEPGLQQLASVLTDVAREAGRAVAETETEADASSAASSDRGTLWPRAWHKQEAPAWPPPSPSWLLLPEIY